MVTRREVLGGSVFGASAPLAWGEQAAPLDPRQVRDLIGGLEEIGEQLRSANGGSFTGSSAVVDKIRDAMTLFLRSSQKYPDFMEVGHAVFHAMYDWHIRNRLQLVVGRGADGRYGLMFMFTRLILRSDTAADYIGLPYDQRP